MYRLISISALFLLPFFLRGQDTHSVGKTKDIALKMQFCQLKDQFNYGLVYNGINIAGSYYLERRTENGAIIYNPELGLGINTNQGEGLVSRIKPLDFFYGWKLSSAPVLLGIYTSANYIWQLYPHIQSGHMFWFTTMDIGPQVIVTVPLPSRTIRIVFSNSLAGFTSRPQPSTETYFYTLKFSDFISDSHQDMAFGSFDQFNHTRLDVDLLNENRKMTLGYSFEYYGYYKDPEFRMISHSLNLKWKTGRRWK